MSSKEEWKKYKAEILKRIDDFSFIFAIVKQQQDSGDNYVMGLCPLHDDHNPSFAYNKKTGRWKCFASCGGGSAIDFIMNTSGKPFKQTLLELGDKVGVPRPSLPSKSQKRRPFISGKLVEQWCKNLWAKEDRLKWLKEERGLLEETIKKYKIGWEPKHERYTIPIPDEHGNIVNVRLYNSKAKKKVLNYTDKKHKYGSPPRLYGIDELVKYEGKQVILVEGETDRLLAMQHGFMTVTGTHGCGTFRPDWLPYFKNKDVVTIYDCDEEGQKVIIKIISKAFENSEVNSFKSVLLPLKGSKDDKDVTDYLHKRKFTAEDLQGLIDKTELYPYTKEETSEEIVSLDSFVEIEHESMVNKKICCDITVCGETSEAFHAVEEFRVGYCARMKKGECFNCVNPIKVPHGAQEYIGSCMSTNVQLKSMLRDFCCEFQMKPSIKILKQTTVKEFFCHQRVHRISQLHDEEGNIVQAVDGKQQELIEKRVYYLSSEHPKPGHYKAVGWVKSHPKTQQITMLIESLEPLEDDYEAFKLEDNIHHLEKLQNFSITEIVRDLRNHITKIYQRDEMLITILLTYCSPRWFIYSDEHVRGWIVSVIIGDTGTGKSQTFDRVAEFIGVGDIFSGLTGSRTGLAYALVEHKQKGWQVRIGRYPANTRKLLALDEVQEIPREQFKPIGKAMNEGFMQVDRVSSRGYESETRLIMLGNPKEASIMDDHQYGCVTLKAIFDPMIIRRIDVACLTNANDIEVAKLVAEKRTGIGSQQIFGKELRALVYWAWNLRPEDIVISVDAQDTCEGVGQRVADTYGYATDVPLITRYEYGKTLMRIAVALAVLDVSATLDFRKLLVKQEHVKHAMKFLKTVYSHENCMLDTYSSICRQQEQLDDYDKIMEIIDDVVESEKFSGGIEKGLFQRMLWGLWTMGAREVSRKAPIRRKDLADMAGSSPDYVSKKVRLLRRFHLVKTTKDGYVKLPKFVRFMRKLLQDRPDFLKKGNVVGGEILDNGDSEEDSGKEEEQEQWWQT